MVRYGQYVETAIGKLYLVEEDGVLVALDVAKSDCEPDMQACEADKQECGAVCLKETSLLRQAKQQLQEYLAGQRTSFDIPICGKGTDFQRKVWKALCDIPYGETRTYGQIAAVIGSPKAARAVGGACNRNPIMIVVPCHRVIGGGGKLVGFGGGLDVKEKLLAIEGILPGL